MRLRSNGLRSGAHGIWRGRSSFLSLAVAPPGSCVLGSGLVEVTPVYWTGVCTTPDLMDHYGNEDDEEALRRGFQSEGGAGGDPGRP